MSDCLKNIDVIVLAGGLGTRLSGVLKDKPKLLAPIGEGSYLMFLLEWVQSFGARRIIFGLGHLAGPVLDYLDANGKDSMEISAVVEERPMGTAGAIDNLRSQVRTNPVLIMNGDSFVDANLCEFVNFHIEEKTDISILCTVVPNPGRYGTVKIDDQDRVVKFEEKSAGVGAGLINAGIYLFKSNSLSEILKSGPSLENDFFPNRPVGSIAAMSGQYEFLDIGTPADLMRAPVVLRKHHNWRVKS
ncbi:sugar phosphate nucleotidyltransferase [Gammaproteobacteria bacterium]|nr:sugar phosphate nucleotidyltransferase [Gammaproteobacteria bacterium]